MAEICVHLQCPVRESFRVRQVAGMFDLSVFQHTGERIQALLPDLCELWHIGAIVGPSGSGKTSVAKAAFGESFYRPQPWETGSAVVDGFGEDVSIRQITQTLSAVGFASPRNWIKPF